MGDAPPEFDGEPSCDSPNGNAAYGSRYVYAANRTGGLLDSICADDFTPLVTQLGLTLSGLQSDFALSRTPILDDTFVVSLYAGVTEDTKIRDLTRDVDYSYVDEADPDHPNSIHFENDQVPPSETYVLASYRILSGS